MRVVGGLDVGTTGCKIVLYDEQATLLDTYYVEYDAVHQNGQHEISFEDVKAGVLSLLKQATAHYRVEALGVTSFGETFALLDENDTPCFSLRRLTVHGEYAQPAAETFRVVIVASGEGTLTASGETLTLKQGDYLFLPAALGEAVWSGDMIVLECLPPKK